MTRVMHLPTSPQRRNARSTDATPAPPATGRRRALVIEILMGEHALAESWVETMLDRIEAQP